MKFGAMQGVLGEPLESVFAVAKELGFDGVELDWREPQQIIDGDLAPARRAAIRESARTANVEIPSACVHFLNKGGIASADEAMRAAGMQAVRDGLVLCRDLGAKVLLVPFFGAAEIESDEDKSRLIEGLRQLAPEAESANVTIAIEHTLRGDDAAKVLSEVGSSRVGDYFDMANCMSCGFDALQEVKFLRGHIAQVHAKEFDGSELSGSRAPRTYPGLNTKPFGSGQVPVAKVLSSLRDIGYDGYVVIETGAFGDRKESARAALKVLRDVS